MHHVCDDHVFKDGGLFFRFRRDDDTYKGSAGAAPGRMRPGPPRVSRLNFASVLFCPADDLAYRALLRKALHIYVASHASGTMIKVRATCGPRQAGVISTTPSPLNACPRPQPGPLLGQTQLCGVLCEP